MLRLFPQTVSYLWLWRGRREISKFAVLMISYKRHGKTSMYTSALFPEKSSNEGLRFVSKIVQIPGAKNSFLPKPTCKNLLKLHSAISISNERAYQPYITSMLPLTTFLIQAQPLFVKVKKHLTGIKLK